MKNKAFITQIPVELHKKLKIKSAYLGVTMNNFIIASISYYLDQLDNAKDVEIS